MSLPLSRPGAGKGPDPDVIALFQQKAVPDLGPSTPLLSRLLDRTRMGVILALVGLVTLIGIPLQWLALKLKLPMRRHIPTLFHRIVLKLIGVRVRVVGAPAEGRPLLLLSNHCSWLDICVLGSLFPLFFVAKSEVAGWPVIGLLAALQRSVFVDRQKRSATGEVNREIAARLGQGDPVVLFAEGTSSDGNRVLPFRSALVGAVRDAFDGERHVQVQPMSVAYVRLQGVPMGRTHRHVAAWTGDLDLAPHLVEVLRHGALDVEIRFGTARPLDGAADRKRVTRECEDEVRRLVTQTLSGLGPDGAAVKPAVSEARPWSRA